MKVKQRWRGDKHHHCEVGFQKSGGHINLSFPCDLYRLWVCHFVAYISRYFQLIVHIALIIIIIIIIYYEIVLKVQTIVKILFLTLLQKQMMMMTTSLTLLMTMSMTICFHRLPTV